MSVMFRTTIRGVGPLKTLSRNYGKSADDLRCKILVVGGGSGGCTVAAKLVSKLGAGKVAVLEPSDVHYYQPLFTLVGGGVCTVQEATKQMRHVLPRSACWIQDKVQVFQPEKTLVKTAGGKCIKYDYMVVALGITVDLDKIPGLRAALDDPKSMVSTNYLPQYAPKTFKLLRDFEEGTAIFTCPNTPIKCGGAPQKIAYLADDYFRKNGKRDKARLRLKIGQPTLFASPHFEEALKIVCDKRNIDVTVDDDLISIDPASKKARFQNTKTSEQKDIGYSLLHVTPPQRAPQVLKTAPSLVDAGGWLALNKDTLQHCQFDNIFGIGDCTSLPTSKTAAAVAAQSGVVVNNLLKVMKKEDGDFDTYDGYTSCPLTTSYNSLILAEFDYSKKPLETFPVDQRKESALFYRFKKDILPMMYWKFMLRQGKLEWTIDNPKDLPSIFIKHDSELTKHLGKTINHSFD